jgi:hypothetical protein
MAQIALLTNLSRSRGCDRGAIVPGRRRRRSVGPQRPAQAGRNDENAVPFRSIRRPWSRGDAINRSVQSNKRDTGGVRTGTLALDRFRAGISVLHSSGAPNNNLGIFA